MNAAIRTNAFDLSGKVAVVTGASKGLGLGMAEGLAAAGADVVGVARSLMNKTEERVKAHGRRFLGIQADLSSVEPIPGIYETIIKNFGKVDILVNNAGMTSRAQALDFTVEMWDEVMNLNLRSGFFMGQTAAREMIKRGKGGKIINIGSILSFQGGLSCVAYTASKSAIVGITHAMANEWAPYNINVNAIAPGYMDTDIITELQNDPVRSRQIMERIPAGRWGTIHDLSGAVVYLASSASDFVHGATLSVDGGWLSR